MVRLYKSLSNNITATIQIKGDKMTRKVEATISENTDINDAYRIVTGRQREWKDLNRVLPR